MGLPSFWSSFVLAVMVSANYNLQTPFPSTHGFPSNPTVEQNVEQIRARRFLAEFDKIQTTTPYAPTSTEAPKYYPSSSEDAIWRFLDVLSTFLSYHPNDAPYLATPPSAPGYSTQKPYYSSTYATPTYYQTEGPYPTAYHPPAYEATTAYYTPSYAGVPVYYSEANAYTTTYPESNPTPYYSTTSVPAYYTEPTYYSTTYVTPVYYAGNAYTTPGTSYYSGTYSKSSYATEANYYKTTYSPPPYYAAEPLYYTTPYARSSY